MHTHDQPSRETFSPYGGANRHSNRINPDLDHSFYVASVEDTKLLMGQSLCPPMTSSFFFFFFVFFPFFWLLPWHMEVPRLGV